MAEAATKDHTNIQIKPHRPSLSVDLTEDAVKEQTILFFSSHTRGKENTWIISLFVILHLVAFAATMFVNDCWRYSHGDCALRSLGRFSFQPLSENPLLGPSSSALDDMGALRRRFFMQPQQTWRLFTSLWLHAGAFHVVINLFSIIFIGIHLEQEFGPLRIGIVYMLSAFIGSLLAAVFVQNNPSVGSSGSLFGLIGAAFSALIRNWKIYNDKFAALIALSFASIINILLGLLPHVDNFSSLGGFISGFLLGFILFIDPRLGKRAENKGGLLGNSIESSVSLKHKLDRPVLRSASLVLVAIIFAGGLAAVLREFDANNYCSWCQYINCIPSKKWSCNDGQIPCEVLVSSGRLTLTCTKNDNYRVFSYTNISQARIEDLCSLICS